MERNDADRRAKELGGIAVGARRSPTTGCWILPQWLTKTDTWIVVTPDRTAVLDDGDVWAADVDGNSLPWSNEAKNA